MHFTGTIWRPPYEANSALLQVTAGCTHHDCKFCSLYADLPFKFRISPMSEVAEDLQELRAYHSCAERIFLTGANPFALSVDKLTEIAQKVHQYLPRVKSIGCFSRVTDITPKTLEQLKELRQLGYDGVIIGTETGDDDTLRFMRKGYQSKDIIEQLNRLDEAKITYHISYLNGLSGAGNSPKAALNTAEIYNQINPVSLSIVALTIFPESDLFTEIKNGTFTETGELEKLQEQKTLIENLTTQTTLYANTVSNTAPMVGKLCQDKEKMIKHLQYAIDNIDESELKRYRKNIRHL
ncbi:radical SAM protein [Anoxybacterium hadale]|uniref:Radical SAM protein n=1 Tax=Anoxybacterium hadale TaxID=3408580 RepID=A0ACD1A9N4_9FIRM|nr:radical SAM protein [Clostridiales bacterium]